MQEIDHVAVIVHDADLSARYYIDHFGLRRVLEEELAEPKVRLVHLQAGDIFLQLLQPTGPGRLMDDLSTFGESLHHVCFRVEKVEAFVATMPKETAPRIFVGGGGRRACFLKNPPTGTRIELIEGVVARLATAN
jgi:catechol 2,3-dioxygenase-like lactoylglutathione lyase family enzyme